MSKAVLEAAAVSIEHEFYGESFILFVILKDGYEEDQMLEISKFIHQNIIQYKWPEKIIVKKEFPRTSSGKIKKHCKKRWRHDWKTLNDNQQ